MAFLFFSIFAGKCRQYDVGMIRIAMRGSWSRNDAPSIVTSLLSGHDGPSVERGIASNGRFISDGSRFIQFSKRKSVDGNLYLTRLHKKYIMRNSFASCAVRIVA